MAIEILKRMILHCGDICYWTQFKKKCFSHVRIILRTYLVYISLLSNKGINSLAHSVATTLCVYSNFLLQLILKFVFFLCYGNVDLKAPHPILNFVDIYEILYLLTTLHVFHISLKLLLTEDINLFATLIS